MTDQRSHSDARDQDQRLWRVLASAVAEAPPKAKRTLAVSVLSLLAASAIILVDVYLDPGPHRLDRIAAGGLGIVGLTVLSATYLLHHVSQSRSLMACGGISFFRLRSEKLHQIFLVLPLLSTGAGLLLALSIGMLLPSVVEAPLLVFGVLLFGFYLILAVRTVVHTSAFLYQHAREQAEAAARAREEAVEAQLAALQAQMNPHFLFNALNTVASLVRTDGRSAEATVENLAEVLRRTLDRSRDPISTVREEAEYVKAYLGVEQERWGKRLRVDWRLMPEALDLPLPPMTLQPLVENALKHGLGAQLEGGTLSIAAERDNGKLRLTVSDDGVGFPPHHAERTGLGNLRKRLATLYGESAVLHIEGKAQGATVTVEVPAAGARVG